MSRPVVDGTRKRPRKPPRAISSLHPTAHRSPERRAAAASVARRQLAVVEHGVDDPVVLGLFGGVGYVGSAVGQRGVDDFTERIAGYAGTFLTPEIIDELLLPTVDDVFRNGRGELLSIGFLLSLWSGSRVLNVFLDTISIMYGQSGMRGIVRTRAMSLTLYTGGLLLGALGEGRPRLRLALGTGVLGGLTTHSTFILESHRLLTSGGDGGHPVLGAAYLVGSMVAGLVAAGLGLWLAGRLRHPDGAGSVSRAGRVGRAGSDPLPEAS
mgnify:CR=1 FL=1